jgi:hypothetical protein
MTDRRTLHVVLSAALAMTAVMPLACGSKQPAANASFSFGDDGGAGAAQPCGPGQPCPPPQQQQPQQQPCAPGQPCPPPQQQQPQQQQAQGCPPGQTCNPLDPNVLAGLMGAATAWFGQMGGDPVDLGIKAAAAKYAPGMSPEGQVAKGNVAQNGHVQFIVNMDAAHCYTIVAFGAGVQDLDVNLLAPPLYNFSAGQDGMAGPTAIIGAAPRPMCPMIPISGPYKVDLYTKVGGGSVGAQVYSKPK